MNRRAMVLLLSTAAAWPNALRAEQPERPRRVGMLIDFPENDPLTRRIVSTVKQALASFGWVEDKNIRFDYRYSAGDPHLAKPYAAELVSLKPDAILATPGSVVAALREQTRTMPIVFVLMPDPVGLGVVQNLARPGGNVTGFSSFDPPLMGKWLEMLKQVAPSVTRVAVIFNPQTAIAVVPSFNREIEAAGSAFGITVTPAPVRDDAGIEDAIAAVAREPGGGLITLPDSFNAAHRGSIAAAAIRHRLPLMGLAEPFSRAGALISYAFDPVEVHAQAASYIDRILRGASPADLPIQYPTKFSLIINLKTAKALGLAVPPSILARADEVIE